MGTTEGGVTRRAQRICATPGCPEITAESYCARCQASKPARPSFRARGYTTAWTKFSAVYRARHPQCELCGAASQLVDHIEPIMGPNDPGLLDERNVRALCRSCHQRKTAAEGRSNVVEERPRPPSPGGWRFA